MNGLCLRKNRHDNFIISKHQKQRKEKKKKKFAVLEKRKGIKRVLVLT